MIITNLTTVMSQKKWWRGAILCIAFACSSLSAQAMTLNELQQTLLLPKLCVVILVKAEPWRCLTNR